MTADLPSIQASIGRASACPVFGCPLQYDTTMDKDVSVRNHVDSNSYRHFPNVEHTTDKRHSEGLALKVKFAPIVAIESTEKVRNALPGFETAVHVDHKHYEQWARVPGRKTVNSSLLRGIQALKARMKRESMEAERERELHSRELHINPLQRNSLMTRDKLSDDSYMNLRRERSNTSRESAARNSVQSRSPLKTKPRTIDSGVFRNENGEEADYKEKTTDHKGKGSEETVITYSLKPRTAGLKSREKCPLQVSVYQPISIGDHVFLINEPIKYTEFMKMKKTEYKMKKDPKSATFIIMPDKSGKMVNLPDSNENTNADNILDTLQKSKTYSGGFPPSKRQKRIPFTDKRTPATVSNAELFDFSQLAEQRKVLEERHLERSKTEFSFPSKGGRYTKWKQSAPRSIKSLVT